MTEFDNDAFLARTRQRLHEIGMTQTELLKRAGLGSSSFNDWKTSKPGSATLRTMASILDVSSGWLLSGEPMPGDPSPADGPPDVLIKRARNLKNGKIHYFLHGVITVDQYVEIENALAQAPADDSEP